MNFLPGYCPDLPNGAADPAICGRSVKGLSHESATAIHKTCPAHSGPTPLPPDFAISMDMSAPPRDSAIPIDTSAPPDLWNVDLLIQDLTNGVQDLTP